MTEQRLEGMTAIVTGAAHGIGKAYAERLGSEGAGVVVADLDLEAGERVVTEFKEKGIEAIATRTDVANEQSVAEMTEATLARFGRIDIVVNNAALFRVVPMSRAGYDDLTAEEFEFMMRVNVLGSWFVARAAIPDMKKRQYGKIINVSSDSIFGTGNPGRTHYVVSKAAVVGLTRSLAREVGPDGIRVNQIIPGNTLSEENPDEATIKMRERSIADRSIKAVETPEDLAGAVAFLASHDSDFITGQSIIVDGGFIMR